MVLMKKRVPTPLIFWLLLGWAAEGVLAEVATEREALSMAQNWTTRVIRTFGSWGGSPYARVLGIQPFNRGDRQLGYFCPVEPRGYLVVSLHKELAPVKAYSETDTLDPSSNEGIADVIKGGLERMISAAERQVGKVALAAEADLSAVVEIDYSPVWEQMAIEPAIYTAMALPASVPADYQEGQVMLTTAWHQFWPYNDQCPNLGCTDPDLNGRAPVGCVATAGAQLMRYWYWPPYGSGSPYSDTYDWPNMPDTIDANSTAAEINAVAELGREIGIAVGMSYACGGSESFTYDMEGVYENHYRYSTSCARRNRPDYSAIDWFNRIKSQCNNNRPVHYRIPGHSIVGDGWRETGSPVVREYHMNYGWRNAGNNTWYVLDALQGGNPDDEYMLESIVPVQALGSSVSGAYSVPTFPYRYVDQDAVCSAGATFDAGHNIQFLPNITLTGTSAADPLRINGTSADNTRLFTRGDDGRGALISGAGAIKMTSGGEIVFR